MRKTVTFILSTNYSGSHYFSLLLGSHSHAAHLGEVANLVRKSNIGRDLGSRIEATKQCYICEDNKKCSLFRNIHDVPLSGLYPVLFERVGHDIDLLVDASKKVSWAKQFINQDDFETQFIHLIRDPRAIVRKWHIQYSSVRQQLRQRRKQLKYRPGRAPDILVSEQWTIFLMKWIQSNREITEFITQTGCQGHIVTYRDLVCETRQTLEQVMPWMGLEFEPSQINYWEHEHHGTQKPDYDWIKSSGEAYFDLRWQTELPPIEQQQITADRDVHIYLDEVGLGIGADGLTRL